MSADSCGTILAIALSPRRRSPSRSRTNARTGQLINASYRVPRSCPVGAGADTAGGEICWGVGNRVVRHSLSPNVPKARRSFTCASFTLSRPFAATAYGQRCNLCLTGRRSILAQRYLSAATVWSSPAHGCGDDGGIGTFFCDTLMEKIAVRAPSFQRSLHRWRSYGQIEKTK